MDRLAVLVVQRLDNLVHRPALLGQADAHRAAVDPRAGMMEIAHLDELLDVVGDVRAEVVAAGAQLARGQLLVADVVEQQRLDAVDVVAAAALELVLDHVEEAAVQPLDQVQRLEIARPHRDLACRSLRLGDLLRQVRHLMPLALQRGRNFPVRYEGNLGYADEDHFK